MFFNFYVYLFFFVMFMFKLHNDNDLFLQVFGCLCLMGVRNVICLSLFICLFIYLFRECLSGFLPLCFYCHKL